MDDIYYLFRKLFTIDRSEWMKKVLPYKDDIEKEGVKLEWFSKDYTGKFNIGDYVTTKEGGYYRIIKLPFLDIRSMKNWANEDPNNISKAEAIMYEEYYTIWGIDNEGGQSGTDAREYYSSFSTNLLTSDCTEDNLIPIDKSDLSQEIRDKINDNVYSDFVYDAETLEQLKATE